MFYIPDNRFRKGKFVFIDVTRWHTDCPSQMMLTDLHGLEKILEQDFTWMDWWKIAFGHGLTSMIINSCDSVR